MAVTADLLVRIAAPSYADAAPLIAPVGLGFVAYGAFVVLARTTQTRRRLLAYGGLAFLCAALFTLFALVLIPWLGSYGAALSVIASMSLGCAGFVLLSQRSAEPVPYEWGRIAGVLVLGLAAYCVLRWLAPLGGAWSPAIEVATFAAFLALLVAFRIVPIGHLRPLVAIAHSVAPSLARRRAMADRVATLDHDDRTTVESVFRDGLSLEQTAAALGTHRSDVCERLVRSLRRLEDHDAVTDDDAAIGAYLLSPVPPAERDATARRLWAAGVDPLELHELEQLYDRLRAASRRNWPAREPVA
jgi:hypothetical protein